MSCQQITDSSRCERPKRPNHPYSVHALILLVQLHLHLPATLFKSLRLEIRFPLYLCIYIFLLLKYPTNVQEVLHVQFKRRSSQVISFPLSICIETIFSAVSFEFCAITVLLEQFPANQDIRAAASFQNSFFLLHLAGLVLANATTDTFPTRRDLLINRLLSSTGATEKRKNKDNENKSRHQPLQCRTCNVVIEKRNEECRERKKE